MIRNDNCCDIAVAESFFKTLKTEVIYHVNLHDFNHVQHVLFDYIEEFYNCKHIHSELGDLIPIEFETFRKRKAAQVSVQFFGAIPIATGGLSS